MGRNAIRGALIAVLLIAAAACTSRTAGHGTRAACAPVFIGVPGSGQGTRNDINLIGDNPLIHLDTSRIRCLGWQPKRSIREAVELTVDWLAANRWVFAKRNRA